MSSLNLKKPRLPSEDLDVVARSLSDDAVRGTSWVPITQIRVHPELEQRSVYSNVDELASSIAEHGQLEAIGLWEQKEQSETYYYIIWGHTRFRALQHPACVGRDAYARVYRNLSLEKARQLAFVENFRRQDLTLYDQARQVAHSLSSGWSKSMLAKLTGLDRRTLQRLELLSMCCEKSESFLQAAQQSGFPLRAAEAFSELEGWMAPAEEVERLLGLLIADKPITLARFKVQLAALIKPNAPPKPDAKTEEAQRPLVDKRGNFRLPTLKVSIAATTEECDAAIETLQRALKEVRKIKKRSESNPSSN